MVLDMSIPIKNQMVVVLEYEYSSFPFPYRIVLIRADKVQFDKCNLFLL